MTLLRMVPPFSCTSPLFARNVNGDAVWRFDRAAIKAQTSAVFDSNPGVRSKAAAVHTVTPPQLLSMQPGTLRHQGSHLL